MERRFRDIDRWASRESCFIGRLEIKRANRIANGVAWQQKYNKVSLAPS
jgi:hypothetical protein